MERIHRYIDCDGVIISDKNLFDEYYRIKKNNSSFSTIEYLKTMDWKRYLEESLKEENDIEFLKSINPKSYSILTTVHSLENEGKAKIELFRRLGLKCNIILSPYNLAKSNIIYAKGQILIDDYVINLESWEKSDGFGYFYNREGKNYSIFDEKVIENTKYPLITTLEKAFDEIIDEEIKRLVHKKID